MSSDDLNQAIALIKAGQKSQARKLLLNLLEQDRRNEAAWLWLAQALTDDAQRIRALERCLAIFPESEKARRGLEILRSRQDGAAASPAPIYAPEFELEALSQPVVPAPEELAEPAPPVPEEHAEPAPSAPEEQAEPVSPPAVPAKAKKKPAARRSPAVRWIVYLIAGVGFLLGAVLGVRAFSTVQSLWLDKLPLGRAQTATPSASPDAEVVLAPSVTPAPSQTPALPPTSTPVPSPTPAPLVTRLEATSLRLRLLPSETCYADTINVRTGDLLETLDGPDDCGALRALSPDRQQIAYYAALPDQDLAGIYIANLDGSQKRPVVSFTLESREWGDSAFLGALSWIDAGHLSYLANTQPGNASPLSPGIARLDIATGEVEFLAPEGMLVDPGTVDLSADWSPNGQWVFTYVRTPTCTLAACPVILDAQGALAFRLPEEYAELNPAWSPDSRTLAFVDPARQESLVIYGLDGYSRTLENEALPYAVNSPPAWSPDGMWLALADLQARLIVLRADGETSQNVAFDRLDSGRLEQVTWSSDGRQIAFIHVGVGGFNSWLWAANTDGSELRQLYKARYGPIWWLSPESAGPLLPAPLYLRDPEMREIFRLEMDAVTLRQITQTGGCVSEFSSSPEAGALAYVACGTLLVSDLDGGDPHRVIEGGTDLLWSPDGTQLAFYKQGVQLYSPADGKLRSLLAIKSRPDEERCGPRCYTPLAWLPDSSGLLALSQDNEWAPQYAQVVIFSLDASPSARPLQAWLHLTDVYEEGTYLTFSPDGLSLLLGSQGLENSTVPILTQVDLGSGEAEPLLYARPAFNARENTALLRAPRLLPDGRLAFLYGNRAAGKGSDYYQIAAAEFGKISSFSVNAQYPQSFPIHFPHHVLWSPDGALLAIASDASLAVYQSDGSLLFSLPITAYQLGWGQPTP
ncbi:MAG: hypothetical protein AB1894_17620 [Chloroflexota bacterium]